MEEKVIMPLPFKRPDNAYREMMDYITKASEAVSQLCLIDVPRDFFWMHSEGITKITVKPKIDWLALNREMSDGSY